MRLNLRLGYFLQCLLLILLRAINCAGLECYECSDTFAKRWEPQACQLNASLVPLRVCSDEQSFCYVERVTVKEIVISITRNCAEDCHYGCAATGFGITSITCTTCCNTDRCNTMDSSPSLELPKSTQLWLGTIHAGLLFHRYFLDDG